MPPSAEIKSTRTLDARDGGEPVRGCGWLLALTCPLLMFAGCLATSIGMERPTLLQSMDFGPPETVHLCVYLDDGISPQTARYLLSSWDEQAEQFNLAVEVHGYRPLPREAFFHQALLDEILAQPLTPGCDRALYFVNRDFGDFLWGDVLALAIPTPEILGEVDDATFTHGFVVATRLSFNQIALSPYATTRHELYHLMGCRRHFDMPDCYRSIQALKHRAQELAREAAARGAEEPRFFPTWDGYSDATLDTRLAVNNLLGGISATAGE